MLAISWLQFHFAPVVEYYTSNGRAKARAITIKSKAWTIYKSKIEVYRHESNHYHLARELAMRVCYDDQT